MEKKNTIIIGVIVVVAIIAFIVISFLAKRDTAVNQGITASSTEWENAPAENPSAVVVTPKTIVTAKHFYQNGKHTIAGEIPLPTPCHILEASATASGDKKEILVTFVSSIKTGEMCAEVITPARFNVVVAANKDARMSAQLNGQEVTLNLIEAAASDDLDNFELYIKG